MGTYETKIHYHLAQGCVSTLPGLSELLKTNGSISFPQNTEIDLYHFLINTIIKQQLSKKAAESIIDKLKKESYQLGLSLSSFITEDHEQPIHDCGVSSSKIRALRELTKKFNTSKTLEQKLRLSSYEEVVDELTKIWGIGKWTADMACIFFFNHEDVWPHEDTSLRKGIKILTKKESLSKQEIDSILLPLHPYRTFVSLHIWKALDSGFLKFD